MTGRLRRLPWHAPVWGAGPDGKKLVSGLPRKHVDFWDNVILRVRDTLIPFVRDGVSLHSLLLDDFRGPWVDLPYEIDRFP
ncbi:unnamed protein product, partial [Hapterophycus canaliculatus]